MGTLEALLDRYGQTYAEEAGIRLADRPMPLYQLLVLATLLSARISSGVAVAAARELFAAGFRTPKAMAGASWQQRVDGERRLAGLADSSAQLARLSAALVRVSHSEKSAAEVRSAAGR